MAEYYSRREMSLHDERIREEQQLYFSHVRGEGRSNIDEFQTLSRSVDHGLLVRGSGTAARFQWNSLFNESRDGLRSENGLASRGRDYDTVVERPVPIVSEGIRNVTAYDPIVDGSRFIGRTRNVARVPIEDVRNYYSVSERKYPQRQSVDEVNGHIGRDRNVIRLPVADGWNYSVREAEYSQRQSVDEGNGLMFRSEDGSHSLTPRSQSSGQRTLSRGSSWESFPEEGQYPSVDEIGSSRGIPSSRFSNHRIPPAEGVSLRAGSEYALNVHRYDSYVQPESHRSKDYSLTVVSEVEYDGHRVQDYHDRGSYGIDAVNARLPSDHYVGNSHRDVVMEEGYSGLHDICSPLQEVPALDNYDGSEVGYDAMHGVVNIDPRNSYPDHMTEEIRRSLLHEEQFTYERNTRDMPYEQLYASAPRQDEVIHLMDESTRLIMGARDFTSPEQPNTLKRRLAHTNEMSDAKRFAYSGRGTSSYDERHLSAEDEDRLRLSNRISDHHGEPSNGLRKSRKKPLSKSDEGSKSDVMNRLKFPPAVSAKRFKTCPHGTNTQPSVETYDKAKGADFKKKLKSVPKSIACPSAAPDTVVLDSGPNINKQQKRAIKDSGSMNGDDLRSKDVDADPVLKVKPLDVLPENSEKFKQNVDEWFFRCMVHLNVNISYQKKFKAQGNGCRLKCVICSSFKEFRETKDVAAHAFASLKVGYRAQHLGFHRALCVLMGWDSAAATNGHWVCKSLPERVAWTLKEDVIIWPPVVIIQDFQARNCQLNEIGKLSIELQDILKDKGFTREIRACHEKPGNPNVVVVEFMGTLPGLKEAERLHNLFAENKHGRAELAKLDAEVIYCQVADKKPEDTRKLREKNEVDKNEDDQESVNRIKDERSVHKTKNYQRPIDTRDDEDDPVKIDQQIVDKAEDDHESVGKDCDDSVSLNMARDDQVPVDVAQGDQEHVEETQGKQKPVDNSLRVQELAEEAHGEQKPVNKSLCDQELVEEAHGEQNPVDNSQGDQYQTNRRSDTHGLTENRKDDQEPLDKAGCDLEPAVLVDKSKDDQEPLDKGGYDQEAVGMAHNSKDEEPLDKARYDEEPVRLGDNSKDNQEPLDKTGYDQKRVRLTDNIKDAQEPLLAVTSYGEEPAVQKEDNQAPVGRKYNALYGYLGIVEELHRLPDHMKKHHLARSKERFASFNTSI